MMSLLREIEVSAQLASGPGKRPTWTDLINPESMHPKKSIVVSQSVLKSGCPLRSAFHLSDPGRVTTRNLIYAFPRSTVPFRVTSPQSPTPRFLPALRYSGNCPRSNQRLRLAIPPPAPSCAPQSPALPLLFLIELQPEHPPPPRNPPRPPPVPPRLSDKAPDVASHSPHRWP